jgi:hypothetical protein
MAHIAIHHCFPISLARDPVTQAQEGLHLEPLSSRRATFSTLSFQAADQLILGFDHLDHFHSAVPKYLFLHFLRSDACIEGRHGYETLASSIAHTTSVNLIPADHGFS